MLHILAGLLLFASDILGNNTKTISNMDGLSNSAIFSMYQDRFGYLWIGTTDGLDIWDGHVLEHYISNNERNFFAGNAIRELSGDNNGKIWILTYYGIAKLCPSSRHIQYYDSITQAQGITCDNDGIAYIISKDNSLLYYNKKEDEISKCPLNFLCKGETVKRLIYHNHILYCFTDSNIYLIQVGVNHTGTITAALKKKINQDIHFVSTTPDGNIFHFADLNKNLYTFNIENYEVAPYSSIGHLLPQSEKIRAILPSADGIYIGLSARGAFFCPAQGNDMVSTPINVGVWRLMKDIHQDIIWVATDGHGIIRWNTSDTGFEEITYNKLPFDIKMPTRSIFLDKNGQLWCGTKGDGIFILSDWSPNTYFDKNNVSLLNTDNSSLTNDNVYSIVESRHGIWIGTDGPGINYYSYRKNEMGTVSGSGNISDVHVLYEQNDTTLWVATHGHGIYKCRFHWKNNTYPIITGIRQIPFPTQSSEVERIFSLHPQNDSLLWLGCRFSGIACLNTADETIHVLEIPKKMGSAANDVYGIAISDRLNLATGCGLVTYDMEKDEFGFNNHIANRSLHAILNDDKGNLWMSGNYGLVCYNEKNMQSTTYDYNSGLSIVEYSDGAGYRDPASGTLFFGGINGCTIIRERDSKHRTSCTYHPPINITHYIVDNVKKRFEESYISLPHNKSSFRVIFSVVDNINYSNYEFFWRIKNISNGWISNGNTNLIDISTLPHGKYELEIYYRDHSCSYNSPVKTVPIRITPPIYAKWWAQLIYFLILICVIFYCIYKFRKKYLRIKEELRLTKAANNVDYITLEQMKNIIHENLSNPDLSPLLIADKLHISDRVLYRRLGEAQQYKPQRLIREIRMKKAAELLTNTKMTIEEVMYSIGYNNRSTFFKNFKESYGVTPKAYRSNHGKE